MNELWRFLIYKFARTQYRIIAILWFRFVNGPTASPEPESTNPKRDLKPKNQTQKAQVKLCLKKAYGCHSYAVKIELLTAN